MNNKIDIKQTFYENILVIFNNILALIIIFLGMRVLQTIQDENIKVFGLVVLLLLYLKLADFRITTVYEENNNEE